MMVHEADGVGDAIRQVMEPGETVLAAAKAMASWLPKWMLVAVFVPYTAWTILVARYLPGLHVIGRVLILIVSNAIVGGALSVYSDDEDRRRPVYVAVTQRQLICLRLEKAGAAGPVLFSAMLPFVHMECVHRPLRRWSYVRYRGPGVREHGLRLYCPRNQRDEMTALLRALQCAGGQVNGLPVGGSPGMLS
jgi:hypothetical protein